MFISGLVWLRGTIYTKSFSCTVYYVQWLKHLTKLVSDAVSMSVYSNCEFSLILVSIQTTFYSVTPVASHPLLYSSLCWIPRTIEKTVAHAEVCFRFFRQCLSFQPIL